MAGDAPIVASAVGTVPVDYQVPGSQEILLKSVSAIYDGSGSAAAWFPCLEIVSPAGTVMLSAVSAQQVAAGASADVSWFPGVSEAVIATNVVSVGALVQLPNTSPQSIPTGGTGAFISFTTVQFDTNGMFSAGAPDRLTCQVPGSYLVVGSPSFVTNGVGDRFGTLSLNANPVTSLAFFGGPAPAGAFWGCQLAVVVSLNVGDFIGMRAGQTTGGNLNTGDCSLSVIATGGQPI